MCTTLLTARIVHKKAKQTLSPFTPALLVRFTYVMFSAPGARLESKSTR